VQQTWLEGVATLFQYKNQYLTLYTFMELDLHQLLKVADITKSKVRFNYSHSIDCTFANYTLKQTESNLIIAM